jgi:hypothetical protein
MLREFRDRFVGAMQGADQWVAAEALKRAQGNRAAGVARQHDYVMNTGPETVATRLQAEMGKNDKWHASVLGRLRNEAKRPAVAASYADQLNRGPFQMTQRGVMEAINEGIAQNPYIRRGLLPTAIGGGGLMAGAAVTAGAQNLMALMQFMQGGQQQQERVQESPLA